MILRTVFLLGLGAAQPLGLALSAASSPLESVRPEAQSESQSESQSDAAPAADRTEASAARALAKDLASWRVDSMTRGEAPAALRDLVARGERLVAQSRADERPAREAAIALLSELYVEEFQQAERRLGAAALRALFLKRLSAAHDRAEGAEVAALSRAAASVVTPERIERLLRAPLVDMGNAEAGAETLEERRRAGPHAQMIAAAVADALENGDRKLIQQLGASATEALSEAALRQSGERASGAALDPLELLAGLDAGAALDAALVLTQSDDLLLKLRVVEGFSVLNPFSQDSVWNRVPGGAFELLDPAWADVVVSLYQAPAVPQHEADRFLRTLALRGYAPGELQALLPGCLTRMRLSEGPTWPVVVEAAAELLVSDEPEAQRAGLRITLLSESIAPAWRLADSEDRGVRQLLANAFGPRRVGQQEVVPALDAAYREALRTFVGVIDSGERPTAPKKDPVAVALRLASEVKRAGGAAGDPPLSSETLIQLYGGDLLMTPAAFEAALLHVEFLGERDRFLAIQAASRTILRALDATDSWWRARAGNLLQSLLGVAAKHGDGEAVLGVFSEDADANDWRQLVEVDRASTGSTRFSPSLKQLPAAQQMGVARALWRVGYDNFGRLDEDELSLRRDHWLDLASEKLLPREARVWALEAMAGESTSPAPADAAPRLASIVVDLGRNPIGSLDLKSMGMNPEEYLNELLDHPSASDEVVLGVFVHLRDASTVDRLLKRFPPATWSKHRDAPLLSAVISSLAQRRDPAFNEALMAANIPYTAIQSYLIEALRATRYAGHLPVGGAILKAGMAKRSRAIGYVASFMTDDAARYLVEAMEAAREDSYRDELFAALQELTERRAVAEKWRRSPDAAERHDAAVAALVLVIDDAEATALKRVEAIRGLGLLDARDELPRLIDLLDSKDEALRRAARSAIDRMGQ